MNKLRREDRAISEQEALEILHKGEYGILSMCTLKNEGYGIPLHYVMDGDKIYFHCARDGSKIDYLRNNNKVSFCVVGKTEVMPSEFATLYESAIAAGETSEVGDDEKREALTLLIAKYSGDYKEEGKVYIEKLFDRVAIIKMSVKSVTGKARKL